MIVRGRVLMATALAVCILGGSAPSAHALFGRHKTKKNPSPYAYLAPKKQKKPSGWYRSTLNGNLVYGKPKKK